MDTVSSLLPPLSTFGAIRRIILFGSRARGDFEERSDIDLAIDAPGIGILEWDKICHYVEDTSPTLLPIDLIWLQRAPASLCRQVEKDGVILFEREDESIH